MSPSDDLPFLSFYRIAPCSFEDYPHLVLIEKGIDRRTLLDIAPDREELFMSQKSIEEYRDTLKLRGSPAKFEWLHMTTQRQDVRKLRNTPDRTSAFIANGPDENGIGSLHIVRRTSASAFSPLSTLTNLENDDDTDTGTRSYNISWGVANLSTRDVLVSPRPLGPTHICVLIEDDTLDCRSDTAKSKQRGAKPRPPLYTQTIDQPINDLLFTLNAPNLMPADAHSGVSALSALPRRLYKELPRVGIRVPHLNTFPNLVVYLHKKNQAELFRKIIPEFIRDIMHSLFTPRIVRVVGGVGASDTVTLSSFDGRESVKTTGNTLGRWVTLPFKRINSVIPDSASSASLNGSKMSVTQEEIDVVAKEIVRAAKAIGEEDVLVETVTSLDGLRDNLLFVGFLEHGLWDELELSRQVLLRAIGIGAALA
ncbi:hypothetical protein V5O48_006668 [Marasmius crinis-equi]|uniref:Uncharacterized protein n=1 Tax=Marasmius crinis-equi TaxID=585013 RepID=A0ABR3FIW7_9AGAR